MTQGKEPSKKGNKMGERDEKGRFLPGHKGNPNAEGRPRNELSLTNAMRELLPQPCPYDARGRTWLEWLADRGMALAGENYGYFREVIERLEGKVTQPIEGQFTTEISWIIGKGYGNGNADIPADKQATERFCRN